MSGEQTCVRAPGKIPLEGKTDIPFYMHLGVLGTLSIKANHDNSVNIPNHVFIISHKHLNTACSTQSLIRMSDRITEQIPESLAVLKEATAECDDQAWPDLDPIHDMSLESLLTWTRERHLQAD